MENHYLMNPNFLKENSEIIANIIYYLATPLKNNGVRLASDALFKLPPVFSNTNHDKYGNGKKNLVAMIKTISEYNNNKSLTLNDLPSIYNINGGLPDLTIKDMRKVHNWTNQVEFGLRAAMIYLEHNRSHGNFDYVPDKVFKTLYANNRR